MYPQNVTSGGKITKKNISAHSARNFVLYSILKMVALSLIVLS